MTAQLGVGDITGRASVRAIPPKKWVRFVRDAITRDGIEGNAAEKAAADGLLVHLVRPDSPAILISYLSHGLVNKLFTARTFAVALLGYLYRSESGALPPMSLLVPIASALIANPSGLDMGDYLPSPVQLAPEAPDIGTSASASAEEAPMLALLMPLLRLCAIGPTPVPVLTLTSRLTSLIPALPVPPFEVGLEGAQLSAVLPEDIAKPLREVLAGMMADLPMPAAPSMLPDGALFGGPLPDASSAATFGDLGPSGITSLPPLRAQSSLPLREAASFLIEYAQRAHTWTRNPGYAQSPPLPSPHYMRVIRLGRALTADPQEYVSALLEGAVTRVLASLPAGPGATVRPFIFFTEELPVLLRWWRDTADSKWPFPPNLQGALAEVFSSRAALLTSSFEALTSVYTAKFSQSEAEDDVGPYVEPEGWSRLSVEATAVHRYVALGLLDDEGTAALTGSPVRTTPSGGSLLDRLASSSPLHLPALELFITYASGAPQAFGAEVVKCIEHCSQQHPPDNLFVRLAGSPSLMSLVSAYIPPADLLDLITTHCLNRVEDEATRAEDPQASLIRFGGSVVLTEALCAQFDLPLPGLLYDARRPFNIGDLEEKELASMNGWIKALFGSDGIDDEIVMTTSAQGLTRLGSTLVQQAVVAAMSGQIDLDTLHSGLSYYATPLLSWCLGGVVGWLCSEAERQGMLSGMHLKVLQALVLDPAFPQPLLRANAKALSHLLDPSAGLQPVLQSSGFDHVGVRARIQEVGGPNGEPLLTDATVLPPLPTLYNELQSVRHPQLAPPGWEGRVLDAFIRAVRVHGPLQTLRSVLTDMLYPPLTEMENAISDPFGQFIALLSALPLNASLTPFAFVIIDGYIPALFGLHSPFVAAPPMQSANMLVPPPEPTAPPPAPFAALALHRLLRAAILAADTDSDALADTLAGHLADELAFQRSRSDANIKPAKRALRGLKHGVTPDPGLAPEQRALLIHLTTAFEGDEELRSRWPGLAPGAGVVAGASASS